MKSADPTMRMQPARLSTQTSLPATGHCKSGTRTQSGSGPGASIQDSAAVIGVPGFSGTPRACRSTRSNCCSGIAGNTARNVAST